MVLPSSSIWWAFTVSSRSHSMALTCRYQKQMRRERSERAGVASRVQTAFGALQFKRLMLGDGFRALKLLPAFLATIFVGRHGRAATTASTSIRPSHLSTAP